MLFLSNVVCTGDGTGFPQLYSAFCVLLQPNNSFFFSGHKLFLTMYITKRERGHPSVKTDILLILSSGSDHLLTSESAVYCR